MNRLSPKQAEKRYLPRWEVDNRVMYHLENQSQIREAKTKDMSFAGACLTHVDGLSIDQNLKLVVYLTETKSIDLCGRVVWVQKTPDNEYWAGVQFYDISQQAQDLILEHAFELNRDVLVKHWFKGWDRPTPKPSPQWWESI